MGDNCFRCGRKVDDPNVRHMPWKTPSAFGCREVLLKDYPIFRMRRMALARMRKALAKLQEVEANLSEAGSVPSHQIFNLGEAGEDIRHVLWLACARATPEAKGPPLSFMEDTWPREWTREIKVVDSP